MATNAERLEHELRVRAQLLGNRLQDLRASAAEHLQHEAAVAVQLFPQVFRRIFEHLSRREVVHQRQYEATTAPQCWSRRLQDLCACPANCLDEKLAILAQGRP